MAHVCSILRVLYLLTELNLDFGPVYIVTTIGALRVLSYQTGCDGIVQRVSVKSLPTVFVLALGLHAEFDFFDLYILRLIGLECAFSELLLEA